MGVKFEEAPGESKERDCVTIHLGEWLQERQGYSISGSTQSLSTVLVFSFASGSTQCFASH